MDFVSRSVSTRPPVDAARQIAHFAPPRAEELAQSRVVEGGELADRRDAVDVQPGLHFRADAPETRRPAAARERRPPRRARPPAGRRACRHPRRSSRSSFRSRRRRSRSVPVASRISPPQRRRRTRAPRRAGLAERDEGFVERKPFDRRGRAPPKIAKISREIVAVLLHLRRHDDEIRDRPCAPCRAASPSARRTGAPRTKRSARPRAGCCRRSRPVCRAAADRRAPRRSRRTHRRRSARRRHAQALVVPFARRGAAAPSPDCRTSPCCTRRASRSSCDRSTRSGTSCLRQARRRGHVPRSSRLVDDGQAARRSDPCLPGRSSKPRIGIDGETQPRARQEGLASVPGRRRRRPRRCWQRADRAASRGSRAAAPSAPGSWRGGEAVAEAPPARLFQRVELVGTVRQVDRVDEAAHQIERPGGASGVGAITPLWTPPSPAK